MILALFILLIAVGGLCLLCGILIGNAGREQLRLELADLRGKHQTLSQAYQDLRKLAGTAMDLLHERHFPAGIPSKDSNERYLIEHFREGETKPYASDYIGPSVMNCPKCSVSVRADEWPQECKACGTCFDEFGKRAGLDADFIE